MPRLATEANEIVQRGYHLAFTIPTEDQLRRQRVLHRDRTAGERQQARRAEEGLQRFLQAVRSGVVPLEALPADAQQAVRILLEAGDPGDFVS